MTLRTLIPTPLQDPLLVTMAIVGMFIAVAVLGVRTEDTRSDTGQVARAVDQNRTLLLELSQISAKLDRNSRDAESDREAIKRDLDDVIEALDEQGIDTTSGAGP